MALTDKQKRMFAHFWADNRGDPEQEVNFVLSSRAQQRSVVQNWWNNKKAKLNNDKSTLNQDFLNTEISKIDTEIADGDDLVSNF